MSTLTYNLNAKKPKLQLGRRIRVVRSDPVLIYALVFGIFCCALGIIYLLVRASDIPSVVPLYYSLTRGPERLAPNTMLAVIPLSILGLVVINVLITLFIAKSEKVLARLVMIGGALVSFLGLYTLIRIIELVA